jgi:hypothetical protein
MDRIPSDLPYDDQEEDHRVRSTLSPTDTAEVSGISSSAARAVMDRHASPSTRAADGCSKITTVPEAVWAAVSVT